MSRRNGEKRLFLNLLLIVIQSVHKKGRGSPHVDTYGPVQICSLGTATPDLFELVHGGHISSKSNLARNSELITVLKV